jgi:hypothetical protein
MDAVAKRGDYGDAISAVAEAGTKIGKREVMYLEDHEEDKPPNPKLPDESRPQLSLQEQSAVWEYTGEAYDELNQYLRRGGRIERHELGAVLQEAIGKAGLFPQFVSVSRGMELEEDDVDPFIEELQQAVESGETISFDGFTSTATNGSFGGNVQFEIQARHGLDADIYGKGGMGELILPAGAEFRVLSVKSSGSRVAVELEQVVDVKMSKSAGKRKPSIDQRYRLKDGKPIRTQNQSKKPKKK